MYRNLLQTHCLLFQVICFHLILSHTQLQRLQICCPVREMTSMFCMILTFIFNLLIAHRPSNTRLKLFHRYNNPSTLRTISLCRELGLGPTGYGKLMNMMSVPEYDTSSVTPSYYLAEQCENVSIPKIVYLILLICTLLFLTLISRQVIKCN